MSNINDIGDHVDRLNAMSAREREELAHQIEEVLDPPFEQRDEQDRKLFAHEALDRAFIVAEMLDNYLLAHPFIHHHQDLREQVADLSDRLWSLYTAVGSK